MKPDKPFKTWKEQAQLLKNRKISNFDEDTVISILKHNSYYEMINNYKNIFMEKTIINEEEIEFFKKGISLEYILKFSQFDKSLQSILIKYSLEIEVYFKNIVAYIISKEIGESESCYLNIENYINYSKGYNDLKHLRKEIDKLKNVKTYYKFNPTAYYRKNHNNTPPWILLKNVTFNNIISFYKALLPELKEMIMNEMLPNLFDWKDQTKKQFFIDSLNIIKDNRNKISHHNFFLHIDEKEQPQFRINLRDIFEIGDISKLFIHDIFKDRDIDKYNLGLYPYIILIMVFLNDEWKRYRFIDEVSTLVNNYYDKNDSKILYHYIELTNLPKTFGKLNVPIA